MRNPLRRRIVAAVALAVAALLTAAGIAAASASTTRKDVMTATVEGTATTTPTHGILTVYDTVTALHHTRSIVYYQPDGYLKTENLVSRARPIGVVLKGEEISYACTSSLTDASVNPPGGYPGTQCQGQLVDSPVPFKLGGDLVGRFCRKAQPPDPSPADCTADPIHVTESACAAGEKPCQSGGQWLQVGNKDHGGMAEVDYYCNVAGTPWEVDVFLPKIAVTDYNGSQFTGFAQVQEIILVPASGAPHAVLTLQ